MLAVFSLGSGALSADDLIKQEDEQENDVKHASGDPYRYTYEVAPETYASLYYIDEAKLVSDTASLLEEVLDSNFISRQLLTYASDPDTPIPEYDYYSFKVFAELVTRDDLVIALEDYAERVFNNDIAELEVWAFEKLLKHESIKMLVASTKSGVNSKNNENNFPYLDIVYDSIGEEIAAHPMRAAFDLSFSLFKNREFYRLLSSSAVCYADKTEKA